MPTWNPPKMLDQSTAALSGSVFSYVWFALLARVVASVGIQMILKGTGDPNGVWNAPTGSLYLNTSGGANTTLWVREDPTDPDLWVAK